jgi:hypothetical protein
VTFSWVAMGAGGGRGIESDAAPPTSRRDSLDRVGADVATDQTRLEDVLVTERDQWEDGPPHELFARMRGECPVHWTPRIT